ncbi:MAG: hypothetical protein R3F61_34685 [Myxococcota bacterium]
MIPRIALLSLVLGATPALAFDSTGRVGVGADAAFTGGPAAHVTWWAAEQFAVQATAGLLLTGGAAGDSTILLFGAGGVFKVVDTERVNLEVQVTTSFAVGDASLVRLEPGLRPEYFVTDDLSLHATIGLAVTVVGDNGAPGFGEGTYVQFGAGGLLSSAGFTFYF